MLLRNADGVSSPPAPGIPSSSMKAEQPALYQNSTRRESRPTRTRLSTRCCGLRLQWTERLSLIFNFSDVPAQLKSGCPRDTGKQIS